MITELKCLRCGVDISPAEDTGLCTGCLKIKIKETYQNSRQRVSQYEVNPPGSPWIEGVSLDAIYPRECYWRAYDYATACCRLGEKHTLVHGETSLALGGHAWVELPNGLVFDGVYQRFYRTEDYYGNVAQATPWYIYEPHAALMFSGHLRGPMNKWWMKLELPMILNRPPIHINADYAWELLMQNYSKHDEEQLQKVPLSILRSVANHCGIAGSWRMKKADLIQAILAQQGDVRTESTRKAAPDFTSCS